MSEFLSMGKTLGNTFVKTLGKKLVNGSKMVFPGSNELAELITKYKMMKIPIGAVLNIFIKDGEYITGTVVKNNMDTSQIKDLTTEKIISLDFSKDPIAIEQNYRDNLFLCQDPKMAIELLSTNLITLPYLNLVNYNHIEQIIQNLDTFSYEELQKFYEIFSYPENQSFNHYNLRLTIINEIEKTKLEINNNTNFYLIRPLNHKLEKFLLLQNIVNNTLKIQDITDELTNIFKLSLDSSLETSEKISQKIQNLINTKTSINIKSFSVEDIFTKMINNNKSAAPQSSRSPQSSAPLQTFAPPIPPELDQRSNNNELYKSNPIDQIRKEISSGPFSGTKTMSMSVPTNSYNEILESESYNLNNNNNNKSELSKQFNVIINNGFNSALNFSLEKWFNKLTISGSTDSSSTDSSSTDSLVDSSVDSSTLLQKIDDDDIMKLLRDYGDDTKITTMYIAEFLDKFEPSTASASASPPSSSSSSAASALKLSVEKIDLDQIFIVKSKFKITDRLLDIIQVIFNNNYFNSDTVNELMEKLDELFLSSLNNLDINSESLKYIIHDFIQIRCEILKKMRFNPINRNYIYYNNEQWESKFIDYLNKSLTSYKNSFIPNFTFAYYSSIFVKNSFQEINGKWTENPNNEISKIRILIRHLLIQKYEKNRQSKKNKVSNDKFLEFFLIQETEIKKLLIDIIFHNYIKDSFFENLLNDYLFMFRELFKIEDDNIYKQGLINIIKMNEKYTNINKEKSEKLQKIVEFYFRPRPNTNSEKKSEDEDDEDDKDSNTLVDDGKRKYLKYKAKYLQLKNQLN